MCETLKWIVLLAVELRKDDLQIPAKTISLDKWLWATREIFSNFQSSRKQYPSFVFPAGLGRDVRTHQSEADSGKNGVDECWKVSGTDKCLDFCHSRHNRICSVHFEVGLPRLNLILIPQCRHSPQSINLRKVVLTPWRDAKRIERKRQWRRRIRRIPDVQTGTHWSRSERVMFCFWRSQHSLLSSRIHWCRGPNWYNGLRLRSNGWL